MGFLQGPIDVKTIPSGATLTRRFGVLQKDKVRPIDAYKASMVNSAVTQVEMVTLHGIDHIACLGASLMSASQRKGEGLQLVAKCWDLAAAYKQIPLSDDAYETDSYIVIYNPATGCPQVYKQAVLPFGSIASVTAFLRCALGIWHIGSSILKLTWTSYFDDFLSLTPENLDRHTELCVVSPCCSTSLGGSSLQTSCFRTPSVAKSWEWKLTSPRVRTDCSLSRTLSREKKSSYRA